MLMKFLTHPKGLFVYKCYDSVVPRATAAVLSYIFASYVPVAYVLAKIATAA